MRVEIPSLYDLYLALLDFWGALGPFSQDQEFDELFSFGKRVFQDMELPFGVGHRG